MYSKPYRHGEYWRIDITLQTGQKKYIEFESLEEAWHWYDELTRNNRE